MIVAIPEYIIIGSVLIGFNNLCTDRACTTHKAFLRKHFSLTVFLEYESNFAQFSIDSTAIQSPYSALEL